MIFVKTYIYVLNNYIDYWKASHLLPESLLPIKFQFFLVYLILSGPWLFYTIPHVRRFCRPLELVWCI